MANINAKNIINKSKVRADTTDTLGRVNDNCIDIVKTNGQEYQLKIVGSSPKQCLDKLISKDFSKYYEKNIEVKIPKDYYDEVQKLLDQKIKKVQNQLEQLKTKNSNAEALAKKQAELQKYQNIKNNTSKSTVSTDEAMQARVSPVASTAKDIGKIAHASGLEGAKYGAGIGGTISVTKNIVAVYKNEKDIKDALKDVLCDTTKAGAVGYGTTFSASAISAFMQNSTGPVIRYAGKSSLPSMLITASIETTKSFYSYFSGEISGHQLFEQLGEKGAGMSSSALFATAGQVAVPIPVVGAMIGGMIGYMLSSMFYQDILASIKDAKLSRSNRLRIKAECEILISEILNYRKELEENIELYFSEHLSFFNENFNQLDVALDLNNVDGFIQSANAITKKLGGETQFETFTEFKNFMNSKETLNL